jgi:hypothetical protein
MTSLVFLLAALVVFARATSAVFITEALPAAQFTVPLVEKIPRPVYKKNLLEELRSYATSPMAILTGTLNDEQYVTSITVGGQIFKVIVDTGS